MLGAWLRRSRRSRETGASAVEYGLLVALIAAVVIVATFALGRVMTAVFVETCESINTNNASVSKGKCTKSPKALIFPAAPRSAARPTSAPQA